MQTVPAGTASRRILQSGTISIIFPLHPEQLNAGEVFSRADAAVWCRAQGGTYESDSKYHHGSSFCDLVSGRPQHRQLPNQFTGDNAIYTGSEVDIQPNVLIILTPPAV